MKMKTIIFAALIFAAILSPYSQGAEAAYKPNQKAKESCRKLITDSENSVWETSFLSRYNQIYTKEEYKNLIAYVCVQGIFAAEQAKSEEELKMFLFSMRQKWVNMLGYPVEEAETISIKYYRALRNPPQKPANKPAIKNKDLEMMEKKINPLDGYPNNQTVLLNDPKNEIVMIKSFNVEAAGCSVEEEMMRIDKITMDSDDRYPEKMTFRNMKNMRISMTTNFSALDNASRSWTDSMFSENDWVLLQYLLCGSGGFPDMVTISKHSKRFPSAGVTLDSAPRPIVRGYTVTPSKIAADIKALLRWKKPD